jgi:ATP-dependent Clp protease ATP-binding subunit ClpA
MPDWPAGSFLFTGPTGVGKTELVRQLAIHLGNEFTAST